MGTLKTKQATLDKILIGLVLGILFPIITFYLYYLVKFDHLSFGEFIKGLHEYRLLFRIMSLCVLSNLPLFYLFIQFKYLNSSRGIVLACFIFAFAVMAYRFLT
ncbi:MAG: hypothetical protein ACERKD_11415 [Prolixibacteraceae bacterium]